MSQQLYFHVRLPGNALNIDISKQPYIYMSQVVSYQYKHICFFYDRKNIKYECNGTQLLKKTNKTQFKLTKLRTINITTIVQKYPTFT